MSKASQVSNASGMRARVFFVLRAVVCAFVIVCDLCVSALGCAFVYASRRCFCFYKYPCIMSLSGSTMWQLIFHSVMLPRCEGN